MEYGWKKKWMTGVLMAGMVSAAGVFPAMAAEVLDAPESAGWSRLSEMTATWDKVEDATGYQLRLYYDDEYIQSVKVKGTKTDLSEYMTKEGWYYYEVRAVAEKKNGTKYMESSEYTESDGVLIDDLGDTDGKWKNYVDGKKYAKKDGAFVVGCWYRIMGEWYYFDENGYASTGWKQDGANWYYMDQNGEMQTGWLKDGDTTYYLKATGEMAVGWLQANPGQWYYFNENGSMAVNTVIDGFQINESGMWVQN